MRLPNKIGRVFGRLTIIGPSRFDGKKSSWLCRCSCGNELFVLNSNLRVDGGTQSCGCIRAERDQARHERSVTRKTHPNYVIWMRMRSRCLSPADKIYKYYGGRGIRVCQRWLDSFQAFVEDVGVRPSKNHSIDRIDNDGHYEPGNVRWATRIEQTNNMSTNRLVEYRGETTTLSMLARKYRVNYKQLHHLITKRRQPLNEAMAFLVEAQ